MIKIKIKLGGNIMENKNDFKNDEGVIFTNFIFSNDYEPVEEELYELIESIVNKYEDEDNIYEVNELFGHNKFIISVGTFDRTKSITIKKIREKVDMKNEHSGSIQINLSVEDCGEDVPGN